MPKRLKTLSGQQIVKFLERNGFRVHSIQGSHVKLKRNIAGRSQTLVIPLHREVAKGTVRGIYNQILEYLPESPEVKKLFFADC